MGKTLMAYFKGWDSADIAQLYVHSEIPTDDICTNYYRMTDKEIIKSIVTRKSGRVFGENDIKRDADRSRTDTGATARAYQKARARTPAIYFARNLWWSLGAWKTRKLLDWVDEFSPDMIFLASGDYSFIYKIALTLAKHRNIPICMCCVDDYYFDNRNEKKFGGKAVHKSFMKHVRRTAEYSSCIFTICDKMNKDYGKLFGKPCYTLCTPSSISEPLCGEKSDEISYIGNLGYKRNEQILALGRILRSDFGRCVDVYSAESRPEILNELTEENGVRFHGSIPSSEVLRVMGRSMAVIHTESFDSMTRRSVAYSVSTKIADSLASGTCILAYGPSEIASIEYLRENNAAFCITEGEDVSERLREFLENDNIREQLISNAQMLARKNHDPAKNPEMVKEKIEQIVAEWQAEK